MFLTQNFLRQQNFIVSKHIYRIIFERNNHFSGFYIDNAVQKTIFYVAIYIETDGVKVFRWHKRRCVSIITITIDKIHTLIILILPLLLHLCNTGLQGLLRCDSSNRSGTDRHAAGDERRRDQET